VRSFGSRSLVGMGTMLCIAAALTGGCATDIAHSHGKLGAGQWQVRLPETHSPMAALTHGGETVAQAVPHSVVTAVAAPVPRHRPPGAEARAPKRERPGPSHVALHTLAPVLVPLLQVSEVDATPEQTLQSMPDEVQSRYAQREEQAPKLQEFRGGAVIIIGAAALVVVAVVAVLALLFMMMCRRDCW
jgi:hypothetical protein